MSSGPVTVVITRTAKAGKVAEFERWMEGIIHAAMKFQGFAGINVIRPQDPANPEYVIIFHFDTHENLTKWENSPERRDWAERGRAVVEGESKIERRTGMEFWFTPRSRGQQAPVRYKMAIVLVAVISVLLVTLIPLIQLATEDLHPALRLVVGVAIMVLLMTYIVMPALTRLLHSWLYKKEFL
jgi:uncharacterized protein